MQHLYPKGFFDFNMVGPQDCYMYCSQAQASEIGMSALHWVFLLDGNCLLGCVTWRGWIRSTCVHWYVLSDPCLLPWVDKSLHSQPAIRLARPGCRGATGVPVHQTVLSQEDMVCHAASFKMAGNASTQTQSHGGVLQHGRQDRRQQSSPSAPSRRKTQPWAASQTLQGLVWSKGTFSSRKVLCVLIMNLANLIQVGFEFSDDRNDSVYTGLVVFGEIHVSREELRKFIEGT